MAHADVAGVVDRARRSVPLGAAVVSEHMSDEFVMSVAFSPERNVLRASVEIDLLTAPALRAALRVLVDDRPDVVLDLAGLGFMDASGLEVIASIARLLEPSGRLLTVRSAPEQTIWLLALTGIDEVVRLEAAAPPGAGLDAEQRIGEGSSPMGRPSTRLVRDLVRVGSRSTAAAVDAALRRVTLLAAAAVDGADGVSVTLERHGNLTTVASSNDTVLRMDHHQYRTGEGPCLSAAALGRWFHIESLEHEARWPSFVPRALDEGIGSILSSPVVTAERSIGALNIYSSTERAFGPRQQELAALLAAHVSEILAEAAAGQPDAETTMRIAAALRARETIARAQGMMMARQHLSAPAAFTALHKAARTANVTVLAHATAIATPADNAPGRSG